MGSNPTTSIAYLFLVRFKTRLFPPSRMSPRTSSVASADEGCRVLKRAQRSCWKRLGSLGCTGQGSRPCRSTLFHPYRYAKAKRVPKATPQKINWPMFSSRSFMPVYRGPLSGVCLLNKEHTPSPMPPSHNRNSPSSHNIDGEVVCIYWLGVPLI